MPRLISKGYEPIPGYRLEAKLGEGQFGEVWRATSPGGTFVALKLLSLGRSQGWKEFRAIHPIKSIRHPHLAPILALWLLDEKGVLLSDDAVDWYSLSSLDDTASPKDDTLSPNDVARSPGFLVFATTLCDESLKDRLEKCIENGLPGIPVDELLPYMEEAAKGIDFLNAPRHDLGEGPVAVRHGDIKPDNIMLAGGCAVICDFGVARVLLDSEAEVMATSVDGSCAYMAPESLDNKLGVSSDQYSLAITYVQLRTGELPVSTPFLPAAVAAIKAGQLDLTQLPEEERRVIKKATALDARRRYQSAGEMVKALQSAVSPAPKIRRRLWPAALAVAAAVCLIPVVYLALDGGEGPPLPKMMEIELRLVPPDADLMIDDELIPTTDGVARLELSSDTEVKVAVSKTPDYDDFEQRRFVNEIPLPWNIQLEETSASQARRRIKVVEQLIAGDEFGEVELRTAIENYAEALKLDRAAHAVPPPAARDLNQDEGSGAYAIHCMTADIEAGLLAVRASANQIAVWDLAQLTEHPKEPTKLIELPTSTVINVASRNQTIIATDLDDQTWILSSDEGEWQRAIVPDGLRGSYLAVSHDAKWLVTGDMHGGVWRCNLGDAKDIGRVEQLGEHTEGVTTLGITPDGLWAISGSADDSVKRWDLLNPGASAVTLGECAADVLALAISADGKYVAFSAQDEVTIAEIASGAARTKQLSVNADVSALQFNPDSSTLVIGSDRGDLAVWRLDAAEPYSLARAHRGGITTIAFAEISDYFVSGGSDGFVNVWSLSEASTAPLTLTARGQIMDVVLTDEWAIGACKDGSVYRWNLRLSCVVKSASAETGIPVRVVELRGTTEA